MHAHEQAPLRTTAPATGPKETSHPNHNAADAECSALHWPVEQHVMGFKRYTFRHSPCLLHLLALVRILAPSCRIDMPVEAVAKQDCACMSFRALLPGAVEPLH